MVTSIAERLSSLPAMDTARRIDQLRSHFVAERIDALLVTSATNIRYLTGFTGSAAIAVVTSSDFVLVTDGRYATQAPRQLSESGCGARVEISSTDQREIITGVITSGKISAVGLEADHVTWSAQQKYGSDWFPGLNLVATKGMIEKIRRSKDAGELARIEAAAMIADAALASLRSSLNDGPTELEFAGELDATMRRFGATKPSFETIVASGPNSALPHSRPTGRRITEGDLVVIDFGAVVDGYCSDMTRTIAVGEIDDTSSRMIEVVAAAQAAGVAAVRPGIAAREVDATCRRIIDDAGWAAAFSHGTGHGVGLDIHEAPGVGSTSDATLAVGDVVTVEPGVYLPAHGGVRIEDTVVVTPEGCRPLTHSTKVSAP
jgi:Xaa-Pro aminopeptidase